MSTGACYDYFFNPSTDNSVVFRVDWKIVGNNKLWPDMQKESWNIHSTQILICSHTLNGTDLSIYGSECQIWKFLLRCFPRVLLRLIQIRIFPKRGKCTWNKTLYNITLSPPLLPARVTNRSHSTYGSSARSDSHRAVFCPNSVVSGWSHKAYQRYSGNLKFDPWCLPMQISHSKLRLFADDSIIYTDIKTQDDCLKLQQDLEVYKEGDVVPYQML
jgi:hypothetical protein